MELDPNDRHNELAVQMLSKKLFFSFLSYGFLSHVTDQAAFYGEFHGIRYKFFWYLWLLTLFQMQTVTNFHQI